MKNKFLNKVLYIVSFLVCLYVEAGPKNNIFFSGAGGVGPGAPVDKKTPIDMYTTILFIVAVSIIVAVYFYQRRKNILAK